MQTILHLLHRSTFPVRCGALRSGTAAFLLLCLSLITLRADVPGIITYQGRITSNGTNFTGLGKFKFALVRPGLLAQLWSQDGQDPPKSVLSIPVTNGIFTVALGDTSVPGMTVPISPDIFDQPVVRLRIWFDDGSSGQALLTPDQALTSVGYAMRAANVVNGSITGDQIAPGSITGTNIVNNSITSADIADILTLQTLNLGGISWDGSLNLFAKPAGGGGIISPNGEPRGVLVGDSLGAQFDLLFSSGAIGASLISRGTGGRLQLKDSTGSDTTVDLNAGGTDGGYLTLRNPDGLTRTFLQGGGVHDGGELQLRDSTGANRLRLYGNAPGYIIDTPSAGGVDLYDLNGRRRLAMRGEDGTIHLPQEGGDEGAYLAGQSAGANSGGVLRLRQGTGGNGVMIRGQTSGASGGQLDIYDAQNDRRIFLQGASAAVELLDNAGTTRTLRASGDLGELVGLYRVGVANSVDASVLKASLGLDSNGGLIRTRDDADQTTTFMGAAANGGFLSVYSAGGTETIRMVGAETSDTGAQLVLSQANGNATVELDGEYGVNGGGILRLSRNNGANTIILQADDANGKGRITTQILQITGGSDLSERFDIGDAGSKPEPGTVVCIDPVRPGRLIPSSRAFDKSVAGVISGAGGVDPGMLMGQAGTAADGQHPVALTGRVYCRTDARYGAIEPGDLLTTSDTPGHAMKATEADAAKSHGTILGKAMSRLDSGRGLVLVLVNLQ